MKIHADSKLLASAIKFGCFLDHGHMQISNSLTNNADGRTDAAQVGRNVGRCPGQGPRQITGAEKM
jgi:hypothetical protein